jgi:uncharacterized protein YndB with AHSA1/START domain
MVGAVTGGIRMFKKIALALLGLIAIGIVAVLGLAMTKPDELFVERQATIPAPPAVVYGYINDLHRFTEWSPWQKRDPEMTMSFDGPAVGMGSSYSWKGNRNVGSGRLTITDTVPDSEVTMLLEFSEPFVAINHVQFTLTPMPDGTRVSWAMTGTNDFMSKVLAVFIDMDQMVGRDFETGLASLGKLAEGA